MKSRLDIGFEKKKSVVCKYNYDAKFREVFEKIDEIKVELYILNSLMNSCDIENDLRKLLLKYPECMKAIPYLLAIREYELIHSRKSN